MTIYDRIKELSQERGISIRELEHQFGYSNGTIRKWSYSAPSNKLNDVAKFFNVSVDYLIGSSNDSNNENQIFGRKMSKLSNEDRDFIEKMLNNLINNNDKK